jgi:hypothetical protein
VIIGADLAVTATPPSAPVVLGQPLKYSVLVRNNGPKTVTRIHLEHYFNTRLFQDFKVTPEGAYCFADPGSLTCDVDTTLAPGAEVRLYQEFATRADATPSSREEISVLVTDEPWSGFDPTNNEARFPIKLVQPGATPSASSSPTTPAGGGGAAGGGLPITGVATLPLALTGLLLLAGGAAAILLTPRRGRLG